jgi:hypothetical protein
MAKTDGEMFPPSVNVLLPPLSTVIIELAAKVIAFVDWAKLELTDAVKSPPICIALLILIDPLLESNLPPVTVSTPDPKALLARACRVPPLRFTGPVPREVPLTFNVPSEMFVPPVYEFRGGGVAPEVKFRMPGPFTLTTELPVTDTRLVKVAVPPEMLSVLPLIETVEEALTKVAVPPEILNVLPLTAAEKVGEPPETLIVLPLTAAEKVGEPPETLIVVFFSLLISVIRAEMLGAPALTEMPGEERNVLVAPEIVVVPDA